MNRAVTGTLVDRASRSSSSAWRLATLARARRAHIELALAIALYLAFACYLTWPLITDLAHRIYGAPGDPYGTMAFFRELVDHHHNPFLPGTISQLSGPEGLTIPWPRDLASAPGVLTLYLLTALFGAIPAYGLYTLGGYTLTGVATFLLARRLTGNAWAALIAGWAFAFYPFAAINGQGHLDFVQGWVLVLALWRMIELLWHPTRRNGLLAGLATVLAMWWSAYFILFGGVAYVAVTVAALLVAWRKRTLRATLRSQSIAFLLVLTFAAFLGVLSTAGATEGIGARTHDAQELRFYAARALEYVVPDAQSPLFGDATRHYVSTLMHGGSPIENTLYVGGTLVLLALVALGASIWRKLTPGLGGAVLALALIIIAAVITSLPPEARILGATIPFPSHFIAQITSTWRVYSRLVMVVMLALALLVAVGLDALTRGRGPWVKIGVMSLATIAIPLDLWAPQGGHVTKISTPGIYKTLASQPAGLVAEYPLAPASYNNAGDIFFQSAHGKPIINGYLENSFQEQRALSLAVLVDPSTAPRLATLGVRYVLVDAAPPTWGWPLAGKPGAGFRLLAHEPYADLYIVTARPKSPALAAAGEGFGHAQLTETGVATWLEQPSGTIRLTGTCTSCSGVLSLGLSSYGQPHHVTIFDSDGHVLGQGPVAGPTQVSLPLHFSGGHTTLRLTATPGPQQVSEAAGSPSVSVQVSKLEFTGTSPAHEPLRSVKRGGAR
jgi:hypothetical protein